jgi:hypothetical protein
MMCAVSAATGRQQYLRSNQIERCCARNKQQHPVHQQIGDETLHLCSLEHFCRRLSGFALKISLLIQHAAWQPPLH